QGCSRAGGAVTVPRASGFCERSSLMVVNQDGVPAGRRAFVSAATKLRGGGRCNRDAPRVAVVHGPGHDMLANVMLRHAGESKDGLRPGQTGVARWGVRRFRSFVPAPGILESAAARAAGLAVSDLRDTSK